MAIENIPIDSGTGPKIAVDSIGTLSYQIVKILQTNDGATGTLGGPWFVTNTGVAKVTVSSVTTGTMNVVNVLSASGVTVASLTTGTVDVVAMPILSATNITVASVATGTVDVVNVLSASGVTVASLTTGTVDVVAMPVLSATNITVASIATGTVDVVNVLSASGVTIASMTTGTVDVVNVLSASGVTIASITTGTLSIVGGPTLGATTAGIGTVVATHHASNWSAAAVSVTSGGGHAILKTSGAHTLYVTDLMLSVDVPMRVDIYSSSAAQAAKMTVYLATKGGFVINIKSPLVLTSAQSLVFIGALSGSCSAFAAGYTVT